MKYLIILLLIAASAACNSSVKEVDSELDSATEDSTDIPQQGSVNPGELIFNIKIRETYSGSKNICGLSKKNVSLVEVMEVKQGGAGIVNAPHQSEELNVVFLLSSAELEKDMVLEATARESLCPEASKTYYTVKSYKILE